MAMEHDTLNWLSLADKFAADGDPKGMRACARELWDMDAESMDGAAVMAEAALYSGEYEEARTLMEEILQKKPNHMRGRLVRAGLAAVEFRLDEEIPALQQLIAELDPKRQALDPGDAYYGVLLHLLKQARGWLADALYLAAEPEQAALSCWRTVNLAGVLPSRQLPIANICSCGTIGNSHWARAERRPSAMRSSGM
jgi:tetratricopeptide (TPR) repeat protein